jgi:hypothetical protein
MCLGLVFFAGLWNISVLSAATPAANTVTNINSIVPAQTYTEPSPSSYQAAAQGIQQPCFSALQGGASGFAEYLNSRVGSSSSQAPPFCPIALVTPLTQQCLGSPPNTQPLDPSTLGCNLGKAGLEQALQANQSSVCYLNCQLSKATQAGQMMTCIANESNRINGYLGVIGANLSNNIRVQQQHAQLIANTIQDRQSQITQATAYLGGDKDSGRPGLVDQLNTATETLQNIPATIAQVQSKQIAYNKASSSLQIAQQTRVTSLSLSCFSDQPQSAYRCGTNGPAVTMAAYVACFFGSYDRLGNDNKLQQSGSSKIGQQATASQLTAILQNLAASANPDGATSSGSGDSNKSSAVSINDLLAEYQSQLSQYKAKNYNAYSVVASLLATCQSRAQRQAYAELQNPDSIIGTAYFAKQDAQKDLQNEYQTDINALQNTVSTALSTLNQNAARLNLGSCASVDASSTSGQSTQVGCLNSVQNQLQQIISGKNPKTGAVTAVSNFNLTGSTSGQTVTIKCQGLQACVTNLQGETKLMKADMAVYQQAQELYADRSAAQMDAYIKKVTQGTDAKYPNLSAYTQSINNNLTQVNLAMGLLGQQGISIPPVKGEQFQTDKNGMREQPNDPVTLLGAHLNPPMPDVGSSGFAQMVAQSNQAVNQIKQQMGQYQNQENQILGTLNGCFQQASQQALQSTGSLLDSNQQTPCAKKSWCKDGSQEYNDLVSKMGALQNYLRQPKNVPSSIYPTLSQNLQNPVGYFQGICTTQDPDDQGAIAGASNQCDQIKGSLIGLQGLIDSQRNQYLGSDRPSAKSAR